MRWHKMDDNQPPKRLLKARPFMVQSKRDLLNADLLNANLELPNVPLDG